MAGLHANMCTTTSCELKVNFTRGGKSSFFHVLTGKSFDAEPLEHKRVRVGRNIPCAMLFVFPGKFIMSVLYAQLRQFGTVLPAFKMGMSYKESSQLLQVSDSLATLQCAEYRFRCLRNSAVSYGCRLKMPP